MNTRKVKQTTLRAYEVSTFRHYWENVEFHSSVMVKRNIVFIMKKHHKYYGEINA